MAPFSKNYLKPVKLSSDSKRLRVRIDAKLSALIEAVSITYRDDYRHGLKKLIVSETGVDFSQARTSMSYLHHLIMIGNIRDVLDGITHIYNFFLQRNQSKASDWKNFVERAFREEALSYALDENCEVHFFVDEEFEKERHQTIDFLKDKRFSYAQDHFLSAINALEGEVPNTKLALKELFDAVENLCKLIDTKIKRLGDSEVEKYIKPLFLGNLQTQEEKNFANLLLNGFKDWVNAHHNYRHASGAENFIAPSLEITIFAMSQGMAYLRLLTEIYKKINQ